MAQLWVHPEGRVWGLLVGGLWGGRGREASDLMPRLGTRRS